MGIFNIFKRDIGTPTSSVSVVTQGVVPMSPSSEEKPFSSPLFFNHYDPVADPLRLSAAYAAISIISNSIASMPIYVKQEKDNTHTIVKNHPVANLFYNMLQSKHVVMKQLVFDYLLYGNAFLYIKRKNGVPEKLIYLQHGDVQVDYKKEFDLVQYNCSNHKSVPNIVKQQDMLHFARDTRDCVNGRGFMQFAVDTIKLAGYTQQAAEDYFRSGCALTGLLKFKQGLRGINQSDIRSQWLQIHSHGTRGAGLGVLGGDCDYIPISQNSAESQMIETRIFNIEEIARFFPIPPVLIGYKQSTYKDIEDAQILLVSFTLLPIINIFQDEFTRKLLTSNDEYIDIDETYIMKGNRKSISDYVTSLVNGGIMTINEARRIIGENPMDGCDDLLIPYTKIEDNTVNDKSEE